MKRIIFILFTLIFIVSCGLIDAPLRGIEWNDLSGTSWGRDESLSIYQMVHQHFRFCEDTIFLTKKYWNPTDSKSSPWYRYYKCPVSNKHYEIPPGPPPNDTNLVFYWMCKEYADSYYQQPVSGTSPLLEWFVWKIEGDVLYMGYVNTDRSTYYWEFTRE